MWTALAFSLLGVVHLLPIAPVFSAESLTRLYGITPDNDALMLLMRHRAVLLALVGLLCLWAAVSVDVRAAALFAATLNIASFFAFYLLYGAPAGPLHVVALVDAVALAPLLFATIGTFAR